MKKILTFLGVVSLSFILFTTNCNAEVKRDDFKATVEDEIKVFGGDERYASYVEILESADFSNYKESDDKVNVYIFRGSSCGHCLEAITFFTSILKEYGDKFNLVTYEVWSSEDNASLFEKTYNYFGENVEGVPYIVIGDKTYQGYASTYNEDIIKNIETYYNNSKYVDRVAEITGNKTKEENNSITSIVIIAVCIIGFVAMVYFARDTEEDIYESVEEIAKTDKIEVAPVEKEEKVVAEKVTTKKTSKTTKTATKPKETKTEAKKTTTKKAPAKKTTTKKTATAKKTQSKKTTKK